MPNAASKAVQYLHRINRSTATAILALNDTEDALKQFESLPKEEKASAEKDFPTGELLSISKQLLEARKASAPKPIKKI